MSNYYDISKLLSYNKIFNFVIGQRGGGKTFSAKKLVINDFLKRGNEFVWVRRYQNELKIAKRTFFDDVVHANLYQGHEFTVKGDKAFIDGEVCGHFVALSGAYKMKSSSFPRVCKVVFDEFIEERAIGGTKIENEVNTFLNLFDSITRNRDDCRAIFIANNVQVINPFFTALKVQGDLSKDFTIYEDVAIEYYMNEQFADERLKTRFGRLISQTEYGKFSLYNESLKDNETFIAPKTNQAKFCFGFLWNQMYFGIWKDTKKDVLFFTQQVDKSGLIFSLTNDDHQPKLLFIKSFKNSSYLKELKYAYSVGYLYFENQMVKRYFINEIYPFL